MISARTINPQSWNRYSYALNRPTGFIDPSGAISERPNHTSEEEQDYDSRLQSTRNASAATEAANNGDWDTYNELMAADENLVRETQTSGTLLIIVGDPGLDEHNVGENFNRVAQTKNDELTAQGYNVIVQRASNFDEFKNALTNNGMLDGVEYIGHASNIMLYVGEQHAPGTNVDHSNIPDLSNANLNKNAYIKLNGCNASATGSLSIAQWLANRLQRTVLAYNGPTHFSGSPKSPQPVRAGDRPPQKGPLYLVGDTGTRLVAIGPG
jgi:hypothetical protein